MKDTLPETLENSSTPKSKAEQAPDQNAKNLGVLTWLGTLFFGFIPSLIIFIVDRGNPFSHEHSKESLNWSITAMIATLIASALTAVVIGTVLLPIIGLLHVVFCIMGTIAAAQGKPYRVPWNLRLVQ